MTFDLVYARACEGRPTRFGDLVDEVRQEMLKAANFWKEQLIIDFNEFEEVCSILTPEGRLELPVEEESFDENWEEGEEEEYVEYSESEAGD